MPNMPYTAHDKAVLRGLASRLAERAAHPREAEKKARWIRHNALESGTPIVFCDPEGGWQEIVTPESLQCESGMARSFEFTLRRELFQAEQMFDDKVIEANFDIHYHRTEDWGLNETIVGGGAGKGRLLFTGATGLGKTHLSSAICLEVIKKGFDVFYDTAQSILYSFEKERFSKAGDFDREITARYADCDLLVIDDLGAEYSGNMSTSSLHHLINSRILSGGSMIISTNLTAADMQKRYDERIISRLFGEFELLYFVGEDIRFKK